MKEYFEKQLESAKLLTAFDLRAGRIMGRSIYGPYDPGDKIIFFMEQTIEDDGMVPVISMTEPSIRFSVQSCTLRHIDQLDTEYEFVRMGGSSNIPVLKKREISEEEIDCDRSVSTVV